VRIGVENQVDEVAAIDDNSSNSNSSTLLEDDLGRRSKPNMLKRAIQKLRSSNAVKFALFREDFPRHHIIENINPLHAALVFYICLLIGSFGLVILAYTTFLGFMAYYTIVAVTALEALHYLCDR
jgi:hypothetical protein